MVENIDYTISISVDPESVCALLDTLVDICIDAAEVNDEKAYSKATDRIMEICGKERFRLTKMTDKKNLILLHEEE